jgi:hypothetical protein
VPVDRPHDRRYLQDRVTEEIDRHRRYEHQFSLLIFEARPVSDGVPVRLKIQAALEMLHAQLRPSDVAVQVFEDVIAALLVETTRTGANDALQRLRGRLDPLAGAMWQIDIYTYPQDQAEIRHLSMLTAA